MTARPLGSFALLLLTALTACGEDKTRAPAAAGCDNPGCVNPGPIGGGDSGAGRDVETDAVTDAASDASTTVTCTVHPLSKFTADPASAGLTSTVVVRAPKIGGGVTPDVKADLTGTFTLPDVAAAVGTPTWLQVVSGGAVRGIDGVPLPSADAFAIPLFDDNLASTTWLTLGVGTPYPTSGATVVVHVFDAAGKRKSGVTATPFGDGRGPFYDDGTDVSPTAKTTGAQGTIVFLGLTAGSSLFTLTVADGTKTYGSISVPLGASAVSHLALKLE